MTDGALVLEKWAKINRLFSVDFNMQNMDGIVLIAALRTKYKNKNVINYTLPISNKPITEENVTKMIAEISGISPLFLLDTFAQKYLLVK